MSQDNQDQPRFVSLLVKNTLALILAGGRGTRLHKLTEWRAKPAVHFGGKFRIVDFPLSNCLNSGIRRICVLTQYKADSLIRHVQRGWGFLRGEFDEYVHVLPAQQRIDESWYAGTADAVYQNLDILRSLNPQYVLVLAGDHVYKMDYGAMLGFHVHHNADMTIACIEVPVAEASAFGVMNIDEQHRVLEFVEKPSDAPTIPGKPGVSLASMGIYIFNAKFLYEQLIKDADTRSSGHDFGRDIIPAVIRNYRAFAYAFNDAKTGVQKYWRDVGTVDAYWQANLDLVGVNPELNLYDKEWPIWTYQEQTPPAKFVFNDNAQDVDTHPPDSQTGRFRRGKAVDSMVSGGCIISGGQICRTLLFSNVRVNSYADVEDSVVLPDVNIGRRCTIKKAVIDRGCNIPEGMEIGVDAEQDAKRFYISSGGVILVTPGMLGQELHYAR